MPIKVETVSLCEVKSIDTTDDREIYFDFFQLLQNAILNKYNLNEYTTWILSADRKQYEVDWLFEGIV